MSTDVSTDLPTEVHEQLQAMFAAAQTTLRQREEDAFVADMKAEEERIAKLHAEWAEPLQVLQSRLPEWIHKYIQAPTSQYKRWHDSRSEFVYSYVTIEVPGCHPIAAWAETKESQILLEVLNTELYRDDDANWTVVNKPSRYWADWHEIKSDGEDDIAVVLFRAHDTFLRSLDLAAEAEQRNAREAAKAAEPAPAPIPDPIDQARQLVAMMSDDKPIKRNRGDDEVDYEDDRTLVLSAVGLAVAHHVSRVADALEHIQWR